MKKWFVSLCFFTCFFVSSCASLDAEIDKSPIEFDLTNINQQMRLLALKELNTFKIGDSVGLLLIYDMQASDIEITFPSNFNLRIFIQQDNKWIEIREKPVLRSDGEMVLSFVSNEQLVTFIPDLPDSIQAYLMRVYVFGDMDSVDGTKQVAAFVDFVLTP